MKFLRVLLLFTFFAGTLSAQWSMNPMINTVVCDTAGLQKDVRLTSDGAGGVFMVWRDYRKGTNSSDIYAQRLDSLGFPLWTKNGVGVCTLSADQSTPAIISDGRGGVLIAWSDWRSGIERDLYAQRIDGNGNLMWQANGAPITTEIAREHSQKIIRDDHGGLIACWEKRVGSRWDIWAQRIDSSGQAVWANGGISACTNNSNRINHKAQRDGKGGAIITWQDERSGTYDIYAQRLNANGQRLWGDNAAVVCIANGVQTTPKIDPEKERDGVYISWIDGRNGSDYDIYCQRVDSNGTSLWGPGGMPVCTATDNQSAMDIVSNNKINGVIITWKDKRSGSFDIYAQKLESTGSPQWTTNGVKICDALNDQLNPNIISDKDSGAIITWQDERGADWDIYAQRIDKNGVTVWANNGEIVCNAIGDQEAPKNIPDNKGGTIIAWKDERTSAFDDIFAHHLFASGSPNSIWDVKNIGAVSASPNPFTSQIQLSMELTKTEEVAIELLDILGIVQSRFLMQSKVYTTGTHELNLKLNDNSLASGIYFLKLSTPSGSKSIKLRKD